MFPSASPREILRFAGIKISCFPRDQLFWRLKKCLLFAIASRGDLISLIFVRLFYVLVSWKPFFTMHPQDNTVKLKSGTAVVALKCAAEGLPRPVISWLKNNSTVVNDTVTSNGSVSTLNLVFRTIKDKDPKYMCVATNVVGRTYSSEAALTFATKSPSNNKGNNFWTS